MIGRGSCTLLGLAALGVAALTPSVADAHFVLTSPPAATEQSALGDPQKAPPCGDNNGNAVYTDIITTYQAGDTITVTLDETIFHPGHYRIALVEDIADIPPEPIVTPDAISDCGSAPIDLAPEFPVLADGVFEHTQPFSEPQSIDITLPDDITCDNCTLQIIQFMSNHALNVPGGCYYHHCAGIAIEGGAVGDSTGGDDGMPTDDDGGTAGPDDGPDDGDDDAPGDTAADGPDDGPDDGADGADDGADDGNGDAATGITGDTDAGAAPADDSESGCSCRSSASATDPRFAAMLLLLGVAGLRRRRPRA